MTLYKFEDKDVFTNYLNTFPRSEFFIYDSKVVYNKNYRDSGSFADPVTFAGSGEKSLYELNVDRPSSDKIYPFVTKDSTRSFLGTISTTEFNQDFNYGDRITGSYPLTSSIVRDYYTQGESRKRIDALRNSLDFYQKRSRHYAYSSSLGDKSSQELTLLSIPKIFYQDRIEHGSLQLDFHITGSLIGRLEDTAGNGQLVQTAPSGSVNSGSTAGVCLYEEGFVVLTGSWDLDPGGPSRDYIDDPTNLKKPSWVYFGAGTNDNFSKGIIPSSSFQFSFRGENKVPVKTMHAKAPKGQLNYSSNPTFLRDNQDRKALTGSASYYERDDREIANVVEKPYTDPTGSFEKTTFINKVAIYDEDKNLLGVAKTSRPVRKDSRRSYMFKLKLDI